MKYFKDKDKNIYAFETEAEMQKFRRDLTPLSNSEAKKIIDKQNEPKVTWELIRQKRTSLLRETDWIELAIKPNGKSIFTQKQLKEVREYRQKLRDITDNYKTPKGARFPKKPNFLNE